MKALLVFSDNLITRLMQDADLFEPFKVYITPAMEAEVVDGWNEQHVEAIRKRCEGERYTLVAALCADFVWTDPTVRVVSIGDKWAMLEDYVEHLKVKVSSWRLGALMA